MKKIHPCQPSLLLPITDKLLWNVVGFYEHRFVVTSHIASCKASDFCGDFWGKSETAKANVILGG